MPDWLEAQHKWCQFLDEIDDVRNTLHCSISSAWFRGHTNSTWGLTPSLFRIPDKQDRDAEQRIRDLSFMRDVIKEKRLTYFTRLRQINREISTAHQVGDFNQRNLLGNEHCHVEQTLKGMAKEIALIEGQVEAIQCIHYGEREAFVDWTRRSDRNPKNSWEILAEMQHYRVPTRLLDWTEVLSVAMYFALEHFYKELCQFWNDNSKKKNGRLYLPFFVPNDLPSPCIWILNPYKLSQKARNESSVLDPTIEDGFDYYGSFHSQRNWPFRLPVPIYPPWRDARIIAQQGMFTCHGKSKEDLSLQVGIGNHLKIDNDNILAKVVIDPIAAVYGVKHLITFCNLDGFEIYKDRDSLGMRVKEKFLIPDKSILAS